MTKTKKQLQMEENARLLKEFQLKGNMIKMIPCRYKRWPDSVRGEVSIRGYN